MEPWQSRLDTGRTQDAWDLFVERYRRLILATIGRLLPDHDDTMDVFALVCEALSEQDCARLRRYSGQSARAASVATWLVTVVRNITIDWLRARDGRRRSTVPDGLSELQRAIHTAVCIEGRSHVEAYELVRERTGSPMSFHAFLREVRATERAAPCTGRESRRAPSPLDDAQDVASDAPDPAEHAETAEAARRVKAALARQPDDVRLAVELFVVERLGAADVARAVGWPGAKTVYNRVYRALAAIRAELDRERIGPGDL